MRAYRYIGAVAALLMICGACSSAPRTQSWTFGATRAKGTFCIKSITADRPGGRSVTESEMRDLLRLFFMGRNYLPVDEPGEADFMIDAVAREQEYLKGWKTGRSLSVAVYISAGGRADTPVCPHLAAGRSAVQGSGSFSSSKTLETLVEQAAFGALSGVEARQ